MSTATDGLAPTAYGPKVRDLIHSHGCAIQEELLAAPRHVAELLIHYEATTSTGR